MLVDCQLLQTGIMQLCDQWQDRFIDLMRDLVTKRLNAIYQFMHESEAALSVVPATVQELRSALARHADTAQRMPEIEKTFATVFQLHEVLQKYGAELSAGESTNLKELNPNWNKFRDFVQNAGLSLQSNKEKSKEELLTKSHDFERHIKNILEEYTISGPFGPSWKSEEAFVQLDGLKEKVEELSTNDRDISDGLAIFHIDRPLCSELATLGEKLHTLALTWHLSEEWEQVHVKWQKTKMVEADLTEMLGNMEVMEKRIGMFKESEMDSRWEVFFQIKSQIQSYERTAALISLLSDRALRPRHWTRILEYVRDAQPNFTETSIDVNSISVEDLAIIGFDKCVNGIESVVQSAHKEIEIEDELKTLAASIQNSKLETDINQEGFFIITNANELFVVFESAQRDLWKLKLSKFIPPFIQRVEELEKDITLILGLIETFVKAERILLEIKDVVSSYNMKRQVPSQYRTLCDMIDFWAEVISQIQADPRIYVLSGQDQLTNGVKDMMVGLMTIKASLIPFFECRRRECPRLCFLSNEDLFRLLATKTIEELLPFVQTLFPNISKMSGSTKKDGSFLIQKLVTFDGEVIAYPATKQREPIEAVILKIGIVINAHVKEQIVACLQALKKAPKIEKVQKEFSWQSYDVARRIQITSEVTRVVEGPGELANKALCTMVKKIEEHIARLQVLITQSSPAPKARLKLFNNLNTEFWLKISLVKIQRKLVSAYPDFPPIQDFPEWFGFMKFSYHKGRHEILVSWGLGTQTYGCESLRMTDPLIWLPHLSHIFLQVSSLTATDRSLLLTGNPGDGKQSVIKILTNLLGLFLFKAQHLDDHFNPGLVGQHLATLSRGPFAIHLSLLSCSPHFLHLLASEVSTMKRSHSYKKCRGGLFLTTNLQPPQLPPITGILRQGFRQVALIPDEMPLALDTKLTIECFSNFELMRTQILILSRLFDGMYMGAGDKLSLSQYLGVIDTAVVRLKEEKGMLQEEALLQAFWSLFDKSSRYALEYPVYRAVKDLYPRLELKLVPPAAPDNLESSMVEYFQERGQALSPAFKSILVQFWQKVTSKSTNLGVRHDQETQQIVITLF